VIRLVGSVTLGLVPLMSGYWR